MAGNMYLTSLVVELPISFLPFFLRIPSENMVSNIIVPFTIPKNVLDSPVKIKMLSAIEQNFGFTKEHFAHPTQ